MEKITSLSCFARMQRNLISDKPLFVDKYGLFTQKESLAIFNGLVNELSSFIHYGDVCLIAPYSRKETILIATAVVSLKGIVIIGDPKQTLEQFIGDIEEDIHIKYLIGREEDYWFINNLKVKQRLSLSKQPLKVALSRRAAKKRPSFYFATSGSTGKCNIVALSEFAFINHMVREIDDLGKKHTMTYGCLPLNHIFGLGLYLQHLLTGRSAFISDTRNPFYALDIIEKHHCSSLANVPTFFYMLIEAQEKSPHDISSLKYGVIAGGGYSKKQFLNIENKLGITLCSSYGMSEASTVITNAPYFYPIELRSEGVGRPFDGIDVVLKDDLGLVNKITGEICFKGYNLMLGYVRKNKLFLPLDEEGFFHTGDIGKFDKNGILHIVGRKKDIIIRGGENLSPNYIGQKITKIKGVIDVCVVGINDEKYGETVGAYILVNDLNLVESIKLSLNRVLLKREMPTRLIVSTEMPLLNNGKHDLVSIRKMLYEKVE